MLCGLSIANGDLTGIWFVNLASLFIAAASMYKAACLVSNKIIGLMSASYVLIALTSLEHAKGTTFYALP